MESRNRPLIIVIFIFLVAFFVIRFFVLQGQLKHDWNPWQELESQEPYGYSLFLELLDEATDNRVYMGRSSIIDSLPLVEDTLTYFYMDYEFEGNEDELNHLMEFVSLGNDAFICVDNIYSFREVLGLDYHYTVREYYDSTEVVKMNFVADALSTDSGYTFQFFHADTVANGPWNYFDMDTYADSMMIYDHADPIGKVWDAINFTSFPVEKGKVYFHLQQRLFANIHLKEESGFEYASKVLSHFGDKPIYIDRYNSIYRDPETVNENQSESPLLFIFGQQSLRYAWYTLLVTVLLFLLFRSKKQQRIIPIIPSLTNTSIEFARALGSLYYQSNSPRFLCNEMMKLFHNFNRRRYNIQPGKKGETNEEILARKSKVPASDLAKIYDLERRLKYNEMARMNEVVPLFKALKNYYKTAK